MKARGHFLQGDVTQKRVPSLPRNPECIGPPRGQLSSGSCGSHILDSAPGGRQPPGADRTGGDEEAGAGLPRGPTRNPDSLQSPPEMAPTLKHCPSISETREETNSPLLGLLRRSAERTRHRRSDGEFSRKRGVGVSTVGPNFYTPGYLCLSRTISWEAHNALEYSRKKVGFGMGWPKF